jgi:2-phospho-L-lactate transferase/gluconeogenesis factor (CofD/UPF0052 family)
MTQPGETDGYTAAQHLETVRKYAPQMHFDFVVVNDRKITGEQAARYAADGAQQIGDEDIVLDGACANVTELVRADLLDDDEKVRHNSERLARVVMACHDKAPTPAGIALR